LSHQLRPGRASSVAGKITYYVYVVELDDSVGQRVDPKYPNVYVGQSVHPPEKRFAQHKTGFKAGRKKVQKHGKWLRPKLYMRYNPIDTRNLALARETWLATRLRDLGYTVHGGH
jgi:hypothetical protein